MNHPKNYYCDKQVIKVTNHLITQTSLKTVKFKLAVQSQNRE